MEYIYFDLLQLHIPEQANGLGDLLDPLGGGPKLNKDLLNHRISLHPYSDW